MFLAWFDEGKQFYVHDGQLAFISIPDRSDISYSRADRRILTMSPRYQQTAECYF